MVVYLVVGWMTVTQDGSPDGLYGCQTMENMNNKVETGKWHYMGYSRNPERSIALLEVGKDVAL
ncbi:hypothetical protein MUK42_36620 [Musa troglodytarum]|uniref:Uncharacterized protein n=1 Tax=Musa troglodytarum TaxID=320322 RepID=A0A9E7G1N7_9LILI|nr:hypothetical protein MUK42_36620 [Musa troglodytarum]